GEGIRGVAARGGRRTGTPAVPRFRPWRTRAGGVGVGGRAARLGGGMKALDLVGVEIEHLLRRFPPGKYREIAEIRLRHHALEALDAGIPAPTVIDSLHRLAEVEHIAPRGAHRRWTLIVDDLVRASAPVRVHAVRPAPGHNLLRLAKFICS